jgi:hypothetical protein
VHPAGAALTIWAPSSAATSRENESDLVITYLDAVEVEDCQVRKRSGQEAGEAQRVTPVDGNGNKDPSLPLLYHRTWSCAPPDLDMNRYSSIVHKARKMVQNGPE